MMKSLSSIIFVGVISLLTITTSTFASLSIDNLNDPTVIDFTGFNGSGFSPTPSAGQLDSDTWSVTGLSDGSLGFGGTANTGDFARGSSTGGVGTGGIYAFEVSPGNTSLGVQPGATDWTLGSFVLRLQNNTGVTITSLEIDYNVYIYNNADRSNSFNFFHSATNDFPVDTALLTVTSPLGEDTSPSWVQTSQSTTLSGLSIADGEDYFLRWFGDDISGEDTRDEFGLDDIEINAVPELSLIHI